MPWDPSVLRKYGTTSQFRLLNQVRSELRSNPLSRNQNGELNLGMGRRGSSYRVPVEVRGSGASQTSRSEQSIPAPGVASGPMDEGADSRSFRERLRSVQMR